MHNDCRIIVVFVVYPKSSSAPLRTQNHLSLIKSLPFKSGPALVQPLGLGLGWVHWDRGMGLGHSIKINVKG